MILLWINTLPGSRTGVCVCVCTEKFSVGRYKHTRVDCCDCNGPSQATTTSCQPLAPPHDMASQRAAHFIIVFVFSMAQSISTTIPIGTFISFSSCLCIGKSFKQCIIRQGLQRDWNSWKVLEFSSKSFRNGFPGSTGFFKPQGIFFLISNMFSGPGILPYVLSIFFLL